MLELLKLMVQPVVLERDEDGAIVGEKVGEAVALFQVDAIEAYVKQLQAEIATANAAQNGSGE